VVDFRHSVVVVWVFRSSWSIVVDIVIIVQTSFQLQRIYTISLSCTEWPKNEAILLLTFERLNQFAIFLLTKISETASLIYLLTYLFFRSVRKILQINRAFWGCQQSKLSSLSFLHHSVVCYFLNILFINEISDAEQFTLQELGWHITKESTEHCAYTHYSICETL